MPSSASLSASLGGLSPRHKHPRARWHPTVAPRDSAGWLQVPLLLSPGLTLGGLTLPRGHLGQGVRPSQGCRQAVLADGLRSVGPASFHHGARRTGKVDAARPLPPYPDGQSLCPGSEGCRLPLLLGRMCGCFMGPRVQRSALYKVTSHLVGGSRV